MPVDGSAAFDPAVPPAIVAASENTLLRADGALPLTVTATDLAGNAQTVDVAVTIDNTTPAGALVSPTAGSTVSGMVSIVAQSSDPNVVSIVIKVDGSFDGSTTTASSLTVHHDTAGRAAGPMLIEVVVTDLADNTGTHPATVNVGNLRWKFDLETFHLQARGRGVVTAHVKGPAAASIIPITAHVIELRVRGGNSVYALNADWQDDHEHRGSCQPTRREVAIRFDRQTFLAAVRAGIAFGLLPSHGGLRVGMRGEPAREAQGSARRGRACADGQEAEVSGGWGGPDLNRHAQRQSGAKPRGTAFLGLAHGAA